MASTEDALVSRVYEWSNAGGYPGPVQMFSQAQGFCFLTSIDGNYNGMGGPYRPRITAKNGYWWLDGSPEFYGRAQARADIWAQCAPWSDFNATPMSAVSVPFNLEAPTSYFGLYQTPDESFEGPSSLPKNLPGMWDKRSFCS